MTFAVSLPQNLKYKRFNKRFSKISGVCESHFNQVLSTSSFTCGLKCLEGGFLSVHQVHQYVLLLRRAIGKGRLGWSRLRLFLNVKIPKTSKSAGHRMGKGKGAVRFWGMTIRQGAFLFKIKKSPFKSSYIDSVSWSFIYAIEEFIETYVSVIWPSEQVTFYSGFLPVLSNNTSLVFYYVDFLQNLDKVSNVNFVNLIYSLRYYIQNMQKKIDISCLESVVLSNKFTANRSNHLLLLLLNFILMLKRRVTKYQYKYRKHERRTALRIYKKKYLFFRKYRIRICLFKKIFSYLTLLHTKMAPHMSYTNSSDTVALDIGFIETKAYIERFQKYPDFKISYLPSLFRGLNRIKKKLPFKTEVIFFEELGAVFSDISAKHKKLKHITQK